jgi:hypothetical protein
MPLHLYVCPHLSGTLPLLSVSDNADFFVAVLSSGPIGRFAVPKSGLRSRTPLRSDHDRKTSAAPWIDDRWKWIRRLLQCFGIRPSWCVIVRRLYVGSLLFVEGKSDFGRGRGVGRDVHRRWVECSPATQAEILCTMWRGERRRKCKS